MIYRVEIRQSAKKSLANIPHKYQGNIIDSIRQLSKQPRPKGCKKLSGRSAWRIRIGRYRVIYEIHDDKLLVMVVVIGHRKYVYKQKT